MLDHVGYWSGPRRLGHRARVRSGPVNGPSGGYGVGVILAADLAEAHLII